MTKGKTDTWYSCEVRHYSVADEWGDHGHTSTELVWYEYTVVRTTPKGVWLRGFMTGEFFVLGNATRQRAVPTKSLALQDCYRKKKRHIRGCKARLKRAEQDLEFIKCKWRMCDA